MTLGDVQDPVCQVKGLSFEERQEKRQQQLESLKEARSAPASIPPFSSSRVLPGPSFFEERMMNLAQPV